MAKTTGPLSFKRRGIEAKRCARKLEMLKKEKLLFKRKMNANLNKSQVKTFKEIARGDKTDTLTHKERSAFLDWEARLERELIARMNRTIRH